MALIGAIIGDIIGSRFEFPSQRPDDLDWENVPLFLHVFNEFTDDTVLSIATKIAIEKYDCDFVKAYQELGNKYIDSGFGEMFFKWLQTNKIEQYSWGNGSAMRVSYIAEYFKNESQRKVNEYAIKSACCTHKTTNGIKGAIATTTLIHMALNNKTKEDMLEYIYSTYKDDIYTGKETLEWLRDDNYYWSESCSATVPIAFRCFYESTDYESCMRNCLSLPCDMDTICCVAGGIAEAFYGTTGLDNKTILKQYLDDYLYSCIEDLIEG